MKYNLKPTTQFRKDLKLCKKRGYDLKLLTEVLKLLEKGKKLPEKYLDHPLSGLLKFWCATALFLAFWLFIP